jgi:hypothetical protein
MENEKSYPQKISFSVHSACLADSKQIIPNF